MSEGVLVKPPATDSAASFGETSVSTLEPQLLYRGYPADELAQASHFLETAYLLIHGDLPTDEQFADWQALLDDALLLPDALVSWLHRVPATAQATDVLLAALAREPLRDPDDHLESGLTLGDRFPAWLGRMTALAAGRRRILRGREPVEPRAELSFAGNLWLLFSEHEPPGWLERVLDSLLILCAEHGFTPATLAVRMVAATGGDFSGALLSGICASRGSRAAGSVVDALGVYAAVRSPERAPDWVRTMLDRQGFVPGFQHRAYRVGDPRTDSLAAVCRRVAERTGATSREELASAIEQAVWDQSQVLPAVSWPVSRLLDNLGLESDLFVPLYTISRLAGWTAHFAEQFQQGAAAALRPRYVGETLRHHRPLNERT